MARKKTATANDTDNFTQQVINELGIECALTGKLPTAQELVTDYEEDETPTPVGWLRVTVEQVLPNPEYLRILGVKQRMTEGLVNRSLMEAEAQAQATGGSLDDAQKQEIAATLMGSLDVQFMYALDKTPKYITRHEEVWVSTPGNDKGVQKMWDKIAGDLGFEIGTSEGDAGGTGEVKS